MKRVRVRRSGFTIVELLIVIVVIAILATITIVAYSGITERARQTQFLAVLDSYEKLFKMNIVETGVVPIALADADKYTDTHPDSQNTTYVESTSPGCLPGPYPPSGSFRQGECRTTTQCITPDGESQCIPIIRQSAVERTDVLSILSNETRRLPIIPSTNGFSFKADNRIENYPITMNGVVQNISGVAHSEVHVRGVEIGVTSVSYGPGLVPIAIGGVTLEYFVVGDHECGRGQKSITAASEFLALYEGAGYTNIEFSAPTELTSCKLTIKN